MTLAYVAVSLIAVLGFGAPAIPTLIVLGVIWWIAEMWTAVDMGLRMRRELERRSHEQGHGDMGPGKR